MRQRLSDPILESCLSAPLHQGSAPVRCPCATIRNPRSCPGSVPHRLESVTGSLGRRPLSEAGPAFPTHGLARPLTRRPAGRPVVRDRRAPGPAAIRQRAKGFGIGTRIHDLVATGAILLPRAQPTSGWISVTQAPPELRSRSASGQNGDTLHACGGGRCERRSPHRGLPS